MARCSSCLSNADVPLDDIGADAFARSLNRPELKSKREPATFRAAPNFALPDRTVARVLVAMRAFP